MDLAELGLEPFATNAISVGDTYGHLSVVEIAKKIGTYRYFAVCRCACGTFPHVVRIDGLKNGKIASCGCGQLKAVTKHGLSNNPLMNRWRAMMHRCYDSTNARWSDYGGRGIHVCNHWHEPQRFIDDMKPTFFKNAQLDRIDNHDEYSSANCRWVTSSENNRNKGNNVLVTWKGKTQPIIAWAEELGVSEFLLYKRIRDYKWSPEKAFTSPSMMAAERCQLARSARSNRKKLITNQ